MLWNYGLKSHWLDIIKVRFFNLCAAIIKIPELRAYWLLQRQIENRMGRDCSEALQVLWEHGWLRTRADTLGRLTYTLADEEGDNF